MINRATLGNSGYAKTGISTQFFVKGKPVSQGSLKFINGNAIHMKAKDLGVWRTNIAMTARSVGVLPAQEGVEVHLTFVLTKPRTATRKEPHVRPDIDKLTRAVLDGLTGVAYNDDGQVVKVVAIKEYGETEGVLIKIIDNAKLSRDLASAEAAIDEHFNRYTN